MDMDQLSRRLERVFALMDQYPAIPVCMLLFLVIAAYLNRKAKRQLEPFQKQQQYSARSRSVPARRAGGLLDQVLFYWSARDRFAIADLVRSIAIFGASGSGKTSGSGFFLGKNLVRFGRKIAGILLASKPEDREFWQRLFHQAGRARDLLVFSAATSLRFNFLDFILRNGGSTRDIVQAILVISETLEKNHGGHSTREPFWQQQKERLLFNAVEIVRLALGRVTAPELQQFITGAAQTPAELVTPEWQSKFHSKCLEAANRNACTSIEKHDLQLAMDYWLKEYPSMADKTRSGVVAEVLGTTHVFNTGIVRELVSATTNISPEVMEEGKWVLVDMPISTDGAAGAFILAGWKYLTQWYILKRKVREDSPVCVLWADESQKVVNSHDFPFLAECRSHRGCMVYLTQSIHAYYTKMQEGGEHEADAFLTNFYHKIFHALGDAKTATYAGSLIGRRLKTHMGGSMSPPESTYDALFGKQKYSASFSQHVENILENTEFMQNRRTGGRHNGYAVDGIVVRSAEPFGHGESYLKVSFSQK
jgi:type IV secretory pathway TraG/TraD family ATPase VirD4